jgi:8-oxo-dGTP diphosphatase
MSSDPILDAFGNRLRLRVSGLLANQEGILLVKHLFPGDRKLLYAPPGGGMHYRESAHEALKREFFEETGLEIKVKDLQFVYEFLQEPLHAVELFFNVTDPKNELRKGTDPELSSGTQIIEEVRWLSWKELTLLNPIHLHGCLRGVGSWDDLRKVSGYLAGS